MIKWFVILIALLGNYEKENYYYVQYNYVLEAAGVDFDFINTAVWSNKMLDSFYSIDSLKYSISRNIQKKYFTIPDTVWTYLKHSNLNDLKTLDTLVKDGEFTFYLDTILTNNKEKRYLFQTFMHNDLDSITYRKEAFLLDMDKNVIIYVDWDSEARNSLVLLGSVKNNNGKLLKSSLTSDMFEFFWKRTGETFKEY